MRNKLIRITLKSAQIGLAGLVLYIVSINKVITFSGIVTWIYSFISGGVLSTYDELIPHTLSSVFAALAIAALALMVYGLLQIPYKLMIDSLGASKDIYKDTKFYRD